MKSYQWLLMYFVCFFPILNAYAAENPTEIESYDCGTNCQATLYSDGTFEIKPINPSLSAQMTNKYTVKQDSPKSFFYSTVPWNIESIKKVIVAPNITNVGKSFFYTDDRENKSLLTEVILSDGIKTIDTHAFGAVAISQIVLPNTLKNIQSNAFDYSALESITIPDSVDSIGAYAFYHCQNLKSVVIGNNVESIGSSAFAEINSEAKIYCQDTPSHQCDTLITEATGGASKLIKFKQEGGYYVANNQKYRSLKNMQNNIAAKRIYTIDEAIQASGKKNTLMLRYK